MPQNIALVHLHDGACEGSVPFPNRCPQYASVETERTVEKMQVTPTNGSASDLEDDIAVLDDFRLRYVDWESRRG